MFQEVFFMQIATLTKNFNQVKTRYFTWQKHLTFSQKLSLSLGFAMATGLLAQVRIPLFFTPVPITGQTFAVLMAGIILGSRFGTLSQMLYVGIGLAGMPWFSGGTGGIASGRSYGRIFDRICGSGVFYRVYDRAI
jgi:biotin transport system substrate-specific component